MQVPVMTILPVIAGGYQQHGRGFGADAAGLLESSD
jgi:hypothetical protein